jgi:two-component system heavy metal sensor histidine kinase CusS
VTRSITLRLVIMFAVATLATFALIGAALYVVLQREQMRHQDDELLTHLQNMQYSIERVGTIDRWARVQAKMDTLTPSDGSVRFWVLSDDPRFQYGKGLAEIEYMNREAGGSGSIVLPDQSLPLRTLSRSIAALQERPAVRLIVGIDTAPFAHTLRAFVSALALLTASAVLLVMLVGYWIARVGLKPLERLSREARSLQPKTLAQRLPLARLPGELSGLATAFNGALDRLEAAYQRLEAFNADVAHELRTPLANLIGGTQVALSRPRSAAEFEETLQSNLEELERLRSIINDMLFLARADQGEAATSLIQASVADEVRKTIEFFEFVLDDSQIAVSIEGDVDAAATLETALFRRAMSNLLQNAIQHSNRGARLVVRIEQGESTVWVTVSNPGEAIVESQLQRLFDRFYRVDAARHDQGGPHGHGLGLAIVKAVATMHGGGVGARSADGVTTIGFSVPRAAPS